VVSVFRLAADSRIALSCNTFLLASTCTERLYENFTSTKCPKGAMKSQKFYSVLNEELVAIIANGQDDKDLNRHKSIDQNKGYALLIWFLDFYGQITSSKQYITEGPDDGSCDIIFSNRDTQGQTIFYVVQSKWISCKETARDYPILDKEEFNAVLSDFSSILSADKPKGNNEKFNAKYDELVRHLESNGKAKFIFFTLAGYSQEVLGNVNSFNKSQGPNVSLEVIDIERIKKDYIDFKFKDIKTENPLEYKYDSEYNVIDLPIERDASNTANGRDFLEFDGRDKSFIFILRPQAIHALFSKYKFGLFFKNVRNPLHKSNYNERIVKTLLDRPRAFWYFNNGVTAITKIIPAIGNHATNIQLQGLQIINGAQTVYSIYKAYESATEQQRQIMDADARVTFRLIRSSDEEFNLEIT
jgi:hypothetical protein